MKTSTAVMVHSVLGAAQAGALGAGIQNGAPWWLDLLIQAALLLLQGWAAHTNSNTGPDGKPL